MRIRLRPTHTPERLKALYAEPHDHRKYGRGHGERVEASIRLGKLAPNVVTVADLSCGNAEIVKGIVGALDPLVHLGDIAPGYHYHGPIEETIRKVPQVDLFVCCETLEHLDQPFAVLVEIARIAKYVLLSTPFDNFGDLNEEHYWAWSKADVEYMADLAGLMVREYTCVDSREYGEAYCYGIWLLGHKE